MTTVCIQIPTHIPSSKRYVLFHVTLYYSKFSCALLWTCVKIFEWLKIINFRSVGSCPIINFVWEDKYVLPHQRDKLFEISVLPVRTHKSVRTLCWNLFIGLLSAITIVSCSNLIVTKIDSQINHLPRIHHMTVIGQDFWSL